MDPDEALQALQSKLDALGIQVKTVRHPAIITVAEHAQYLPPDSKGRVKNLFLRSKRTEKLFLVSALVSTNIDLKALQKFFNLGPKDILRFATEDLLIVRISVF